MNLHVNQYMHSTIHSIRLTYFEMNLRYEPVCYSFDKSISYVDLKRDQINSWHLSEWVTILKNYI